MVTEPRSAAWAALQANTASRLIREAQDNPNIAAGTRPHLDALCALGTAVLAVAAEVRAFRAEIAATAAPLAAAAPTSSGEVG